MYVLPGEYCSKESKSSDRVYTATATLDLVAPAKKKMRGSSQSKSLSVLPIPPSRMGNRKRMWNFVHELNKPDANEELERVRRLAYKRVDRDKGESRYLLKWLRPRCPRVAELDEQHQLQLLEKIEVLQYSDNDSYQSTCGVLVRGWMVRNDMPSGEVLGPGACVDCMNEDMKFECWYGADNAAPEEVEREQRQRKMNLLMSAGAFSKALNSITKSTEKWKKKGHARVTEVIAFPVESWNIVRESQRIDNIKQFVEVLKLNSKILGNWSNNRLYKLCDNGKVITLSKKLNPLFRQGDSLSKKPSAFLVLTGALRVQVRFTLKEAEKLAPKGVDYFCPPRYHDKTVVTVISVLNSGDCLRAISIVSEVWNKEVVEGSDENNDEKEERSGEEYSGEEDSDEEDSDDESEEEEEIDIDSLCPEERVWRKVFMIMQDAMVKPITLFREIDMDESGLISPLELREGLLKMVGMELTDAEFEAIIREVDRDKSGEIDYRELARAIKYGDPKREKSMAEQKAKLTELSSKGTTNSKRKKKMKKSNKLQRSKQATAQVPECEVVADVDNTSILEVHRDSEAAALLRRTGMARKLLEVDIAAFSRKKLIRQWVSAKHAAETLKCGLENSMGPRAKNRRETERRRDASTIRKSRSAPVLPAISSPKKGLSARQMGLSSEVSPFHSRKQARRFKQVVADIRSSVPTMGFNPVVLWEDHETKKGELVMKVITRADDGGLNIGRYPTKL